MSQKKGLRKVLLAAAAGLLCMAAGTFYSVCAEAGVLPENSSGRYALYGEAAEK